MFFKLQNGKKYINDVTLCLFREGRWFGGLDDVPWFFLKVHLSNNFAVSATKICYSAESNADIFLVFLWISV